MKGKLKKFREELLDLLGYISVDELAKNKKLAEKLTIIMGLLNNAQYGGAYV